MSWDLLSTYGPTLEDSDIEALENTVDGQRRGYDWVALTNIAAGNTSAPAVEVGSVLEINGAVFEVNTSDIVIGTVPGATDDLYIKLTVSGGTTVTADWSTTVPTWDTAKGGWFDGTDKFLPFVVDYDGAGTWDNKRSLDGPYGAAADTIPATLKNRIVPIGVWDMDATASINIAHGIADFTKIVDVRALLIDDFGTGIKQLEIGNDVTDGEMQGWFGNISSTLISLTRLTNGDFDNTNWDDGVMNRGTICIWYLA